MGWRWREAWDLWVHGLDPRPRPDPAGDPYGDARQPPPRASDRPEVHALVVADLEARDRLGRASYGVPLQPHNGRDFLLDAYQEALDLVKYLRGLLSERDGH
jgi:hypothetical protein